MAMGIPDAISLFAVADILHVEKFYAHGLLNEVDWAVKRLVMAMFLTLISSEVLLIASAGE